MGVYSTGFNCVIDEQLSIKTLWPVAEKHSVLLHSRIKNNEEIEIVSKSADFLDLLIKNKSYFNSDLKSDLFTMSNIGVLSSDVCSNKHKSNIIHYKPLQFSMVFIA